MIEDNCGNIHVMIFPKLLKLTSNHDHEAREYYIYIVIQVKTYNLIITLLEYLFICCLYFFISGEVQ